MGSIAPRAFLYAIAAMVVGVVITVLWMIGYSFAINPGQSLAFYNDYAVATAPTLAIVTGIPLMVMFGWLIGRGRPTRDGVIAGAMIGFFYIIVDLAILLAFAGAANVPWAMVAMSYASKVVAGAIGGWLGTTRGAAGPA